MKKITLQVNVPDIPFSEQELINVVEDYLYNKAAKFKEKKKPTEDEWFEVNPLAIDQQLFAEPRKDEKQEATRRIILQAFAEMRDYPKEYAKSFKTLMPLKTWVPQTSVIELEKIARRLGDRTANWIEQAFEWAQRIANGESWETICNYKDTANWHRLVVWKKGARWIVGGSAKVDDDYSASDVRNVCDVYSSLPCSVPLVVSYEE